MIDKITPEEQRETIEYALNYNPSPLLSEDDAFEIVRFGQTPGDYGEEDIAAVVRLADGRFLALEGGCDTTGWDCRSDLVVTLALTADDAFMNGLTQDGRALVERYEGGVE